MTTSTRTQKVIAEFKVGGWGVVINTSDCLPLSPAELGQLQLAIRETWRQSYLKYQHRQVVERQEKVERQTKSETTNEDQTNKEVTNGKRS